MSNRPNRRGSSSARVAAAQRSAGGGGSATWWIVGGVAVVMVLALGIALVVTSRSSTTSTGAGNAGTVIPGSTANDLTVGEITVKGAALPQAPASGADPAIGQQVPQITGQQFDGATLTIPSSGTPKVVMFVAHWCPHCQKEVPDLAKHFAEVGLPQGVDLYAVATSTNESRPNFPPGKWLREESWPVKTIADDTQNQAATAYGVNAFPYFVAVDAQGKVVARTSGELTLDQFQQLVDAAKAGGSGSSAPSGSTPAASPR